MSMLDLALEYQSDGWAVIPVGRDKKPLLPKGAQDKYLSQRATENEVRLMWKKYPNANIGLACGKVSGRTVIDIDDGEDIFPETRLVKTPGGGFHKIYQYSPNVSNEVGSHYKGIDIRNDRGYIVAAGSECEYEKKGKKIKGKYEVVEDTPSVPFPEQLFKHTRSKFDPSILQGVGEGERNNSAAKVIGMLLSKLPKEDIGIAWQQVRAWNATANKPPLSEDELRTTFNSVAKLEYTKQSRQTKSIDGAQVEHRGRDFVVNVPIGAGRVEVTYTEISRSHHSFTTVLRVHPIFTKEGSQTPFIQRIDLNSNSAVTDLRRSLDGAYGKEHNWTLVLNKANNAVRSAFVESEKPVNVRGREFVKSPFLLFPFLQLGAANMIFGDSEVGKTYFCLRMAASIALGVPFMEHDAAPGRRTLFLDYEDSDLIFNNRLIEIALGLGVDKDELAQYIEWYKPQGSLRDNAEIISRFVTEHNYDLIIIDAGSNAAGGSPNDEQKVVDMFNAIETIPCTKVIIHHEPKNTEGMTSEKSFYGTTFWRALTRVAWRLQLVSEEGSVKTIKATIAKKSNMPPVAPIHYDQKWGSDDFEIDDQRGFAPTTFTVVEPEEEQSVSDQIVYLLKEHGELTKGQLAEMTGEKNDTIKTTLQRLKVKKAVEVNGKSRSAVWSLKLP